MVGFLPLRRHTGTVATSGLNRTLSSSSALALARQLAIPFDIQDPGELFASRVWVVVARQRFPIADLAMEAVLKSKVPVGSVNANRRHWYEVGEALPRADRSWLSHLVARREHRENFTSALQRTLDDIKVVIQFPDP
jgi:hypothetical protein